jgi:hypothetical protein
MSLQIDEQKRFYRRNIFDDPILPEAHYHNAIESHNPLYPKPNEVIFSKHSEFKASLTSQQIPPNQYYRDDSHRAIEEAEFKSTAVSCQERLPHKEPTSKYYNDIGYSEYELNYVSPKLSSDKSHERVYHEDQLDESLLDKIFEEQNQEFSGDFMKNSLPLD